MKKLFSFAFTILFILPCIADNKIQNTFFECKLGVSTKPEVEKALDSHGLIYHDKDSMFSYYKGEIQHEGIIFHAVIMQYLEDTLATIMFVDSCGNMYSELLDSLKKVLNEKYGHFKSILDPDVKNFYFKNSNVNINDIWTKVDDDIAVLLAGFDGKICCIYMASAFQIRKANEAVNEIIKQMPDYREENKVFGVAGVKFGDDIATVKKIIGKKTGKYTPTFESNRLTYYNMSVGGMKYDFVIFYFMDGKGLVSVTLQNAYQSWKDKEALMCYESVKELYQGKYSNLSEIKNEPMNKFCFCGAYIEGYKYPPITITLSNGISQGGSIMYYVQVKYYEARLTQLYNDEI